MKILLTLLALLSGCATQLERVNDRARQAPATSAFGNCQDHVRAVAAALPNVRAVYTRNGWSGPHVAALIQTPDGPMVLDNGAMGHGTKPFPLSEVTVAYRIIPVPLAP